MSGFLFHETVFGPVMSRRLGVSLGINLLPVDYKYCTFNCIYCECGWTNTEEKIKKKLPSREKIRSLLDKKLAALREDENTPDAITFAGNGEPTIHPEFPEIMDDTIELRNKYFPTAHITVLSNASMLHREKIFKALLKTDNNIQKLDAGTEKLFRQINQPSGSLNLDTVVGQLCRFNGKLIIQSLFLRASHKGEKIDNTSPEALDAWLEKLLMINPQYVMIYPVDRETPLNSVEKISFDELNRIAAMVNQAGIRTKVFG
jgi:wyosine [tRNA(Phe)-imidazoG37] synthetase (radical SAM superfamily)